MIRVAHVDHTVEPGGAEFALVRLIADDPGWAPSVFLPKSKTSGLGAYEPLRLAKVEIVRTGVLQPAGASGSTSRAAQVGMLARVLIQATTLRRSPAFRRTSVVHANTSRAALISWLATIGSRRKLVVHLRDVIDPSTIGAIGAGLLGFVTSRAHGVIANSRFTLEASRSHIAEECPTSVIPSSIGLKAPHTEVEIQAAVAKVGMLARLTEWKGQELLIRAFAQAFENTEIILELAGAPAFGEDDYLASLRRLAGELGIQDRVRFLGHIDDIWPLLDSWDICVHASLRSEPLGQNMLQYLAACRPTIAANAGGPTEWIESGLNGRLFEPGNASALASALSELAASTDLRKKFAAALAEARPVPSDEAIRGQYQEFFERLAAQ